MTKTVKSKLLPIAAQNRTTIATLLSSTLEVKSIFHFNQHSLLLLLLLKRSIQNLCHCFFVSEVPLTAAAAAETELEKLWQSIFQFAKPWLASLCFYLGPLSWTNLYNPGSLKWTSGKHSCFAIRELFVTWDLKGLKKHHTNSIRS